MRLPLLSLAILLSLSLAQPAGAADPPDAPAAPSDPASAMHSLSDIYNRLDTGAAGAKRGGDFIGPTAGPATPAGRTLIEVMAKAPAVDGNGATPGEVAAGQTFWGLTSGGWGLLTGTVPPGGVVSGGQGERSFLIPDGLYSGSEQSTANDSGLSGSNIKSGVTIFGVSGSYSGPACTGTAQATEVKSGQTFSADAGPGLTGTLPAVTGPQAAIGQTLGAGVIALTAPKGYYDGTTATVTATDSQVAALDGAITPANIKEGVTIFGVSGTLVAVAPTQCFGLDPGNPAVCTGHGTCIDQDFCLCDPEHTGYNCQVTWQRSCQQVPSDSPAVCMGRGECLAEDRCRCAAGFHGTVCQNPYSATCGGVASSDPGVCSGHGVCVGNGNCNCIQGFTGPNCEIRESVTCGSYAATDTAHVCSGHGTCVEGMVDGVGVCRCDPQWGGDNCQANYWSCDSYVPTDVAVCSGRGTCVAEDRCQCDTIPGMVVGGMFCQLTSVDKDDFNRKVACFGIDYDNPSVCSGHGDCLLSEDGMGGTCHCEFGFYDEVCSHVYQCNGVDMFDPKVCNGHGRCQESGTCNCDPRFDDGQWCVTPPP